MGTGWLNSSLLHPVFWITLVLAVTYGDIIWLHRLKLSLDLINATLLLCRMVVYAIDAPFPSGLLLCIVHLPAEEFQCSLSEHWKSCAMWIKLQWVGPEVYWTLFCAAAVYCSWAHWNWYAYPAMVSILPPMVVSSGKVLPRTNLVWYLDQLMLVASSSAWGHSYLVQLMAVCDGAHAVCVIRIIWPRFQSLTCGVIAIWIHCQWLLWS
jgi:hypothetical protein